MLALTVAVLMVILPLLHLAFSKLPRTSGPKLSKIPAKISTVPVERPQSVTWMLFNAFTLTFRAGPALSRIVFLISTG